MIRYTFGWLLLFETLFLCVPLITAAVYLEGAFFSFLITMLITLVPGVILSRRKPKHTELYARDGFFIVSLSWIIISLFGALPFLFTGSAHSFVDALFESVSGFTTTGASVFLDVEALPKSILIWRSFTHWIGGMGVLVFIMAFLPLSGGQNMHIMRAESPGPEVSKLVPRVKNTAIILYIIYFALTLIMLITMLISGMTVFEAVNASFSTAGTGGFGFYNDSFASFTPLQQVLTTVFMLIFSINFNSYYLVLKLKLKNAFNTEVRAFLLVVLAAIVIISINISSMYEGVDEAVRHSAFTVASLISTTGFSTVNYDAWPELARTVLIIIMFMGACAGSTGGGIKVSRILILFKGITRELCTIVHPRQVKKITLDDHPVNHEVTRSVNAYIATFIVVFAVSLVALSFEDRDFITNFTAVTATLNNTGPGFAGVGPTSCYASFSPFSKLVLIFDMLAGRLELFPMLLLFSPSTYRRR